MRVTTGVVLEEPVSPAELGSLMMNRRKMPKTARATAKMKMKINLRRRRLFALELISGRERRLDFALAPDGEPSASDGCWSCLAKKRVRQFRQRHGSLLPV
jgi:hypothetical protein